MSVAGLIPQPYSLTGLMPRAPKSWRHRRQDLGEENRALGAKSSARATRL